MENLTYGIIQEVADIKAAHNKSFASGGLKCKIQRQFFN